MKRWDIEYDGPIQNYKHNYKIALRQWGKWVKFTDHEAEVKELEKDRQAWKDNCADCDELLEEKHKRIRELEGLLAIEREHRKDKEKF